jgi:protocatechuate 3,4-dioxygenase beta subunit
MSTHDTSRYDRPQHPRPLSRRSLVAGIAVGGVALAAGRAARAACALSAGQMDGPFYPLTLPSEQDVDLTQLASGTGRAAGEVIEVTGQIRDAACRPLAGCIVEVWQADTHGRYAHPLDEARGRPLDANFQGYARMAAGKDGTYRFLTIKPGSYLALGDWVRPPHIHFKIHAPFSPSLTTQMYFAGDPLNDKDLLQAPLSPEQRAGLQVAFDKARADGVHTGRFDIVLAEGPSDVMKLFQSAG